MTATMDRVCKEALELPLDQRLTLVYRILEQSDGALDSGVGRTPSTGTD
jgi:hypothetical protein